MYSATVLTRASRTAGTRLPQTTSCLHLRLHGVAVDGPGTLSELRNDLGGGQVDQQGGREKVHDRQIVCGLLSGQVAAQATPRAVSRGRDRIQGIHGSKARGADIFRVVRGLKGCAS
jgi:hypothetical protein